MIRDKIRSVQRSLDRYGLAKTIYRILDKGLARPLGVHIYRVRVRDVRTGSDSLPVIPGISIRELDPDELPEAARDPELRLAVDFVHAARQRGDRAFGAFDGSKLIAYAWRSTSTAPHSHGVWVRVHGPYSYSYKAFTVPGYRGRGIAPGLILFGDARMLELGFTRRVGFVSLTNYASLALSGPIQSSGAGLAGYIRKPGRPLIFHSNAVKKTGFEFFVPA